MAVMEHKGSQVDCREIFEVTFKSLNERIPFIYAASRCIGLKEVETIPRNLDISRGKNELIMCTDGANIIYVPDRLRKCNENLLSEIVLHVMLHIIIGHPIDADGMEPKKYNDKADKVVEKLLDALIGDIRNRNKGEYFKNAIKDVHDIWYMKKPSGSTGQNGESDSDGPGDSENGGDNSSSSNNNSNGQNPAMEQMKQEILRSPMFDEIMKSICGAAGFGKEAGNLSALGENEQGVTDYKTLLQEYFSMQEQPAGDIEEMDNTWYAYGLELYEDIPIIEPVELVETPKLKNICIAIDTSGSCSGEIAKRFAGECIKLLKDVGEIDDEGIRLMFCDAKIQKEIVINSDTDIDNIKFVNSFGGTDFRPVFKRATELGNTDLLIYFTDADGAFPDRKPDYDTMLVLQPNGFNDKMYFKRVLARVPDWVKVAITDM